MIYLLDANILIALGDSNHPHRTTGLRFFEQYATVEGWATCPLTENAFVRIVGGNSYPGSPCSTLEARRILVSLLNAPGHQFWPDDLPVTDTRFFPALPVSKHLTDLYLLGLAMKHGGRLATFDRHIDPALLPGGPNAFHLIPSV
jgi:uncharacterized protein